MDTLSPCSILGTDAGCPWMDPQHLAFARAPSHFSPGWHSGCPHRYFLIPNPLGNAEIPEPQSYHSGSHWVPWGAQKSYIPKSLSAQLPPNGASWEVNSFWSLNRIRIRIHHPLGSPISTQYSYSTLLATLLFLLFSFSQSLGWGWDWLTHTLLYTSSNL